MHPVTHFKFVDPPSGGAGRAAANAPQPATITALPFRPALGPHAPVQEKQECGIVDSVNPPEFSQIAKRRLSLEWDAIRYQHRLTPEDIDRYASVSDSVRENALSKPPATPSKWFDAWNTHHIRAMSETGLTPTVAAAQGRFQSLVPEYWTAWTVSGANYEIYSAWVKGLVVQIVAELGLLWKGRSTAIDKWYENGCIPKLTNTLAALVKKEEARARAQELMRLGQEARTQWTLELSFATTYTSLR